MAKTGDCDYLFKLVIVGDMAVGKTSLLLRYTDNVFTEHYKNTIGCDFQTKTSDVGGKRVSLQMWDTSGQERFRSIASSFYRNADGLVIVFDVTDQESFFRVPKWLKEASHYSGKHPIKEIILIGNKTDLADKRVVDYSKAQKLADSLGLSYIETSAKDDTNVSQAFDMLTHRLLSSQGYLGSWGETMKDSIILDNNATDAEYSGYCCGYV